MINQFFSVYAKLLIIQKRPGTCYKLNMLVAEEVGVGSLLSMLIVAKAGKTYLQLSHLLLILLINY